MSDESSQDIDRDACERPEARPKLDEPEPFAAMFAPMMAQAEAAAEATAYHRANCVVTPCERCGRYLCRRCRARQTSGALEYCDACALDERLVEAWRSVPRRFQWALAADRARLLETATKLDGRLVDAGLAWARANETHGLILRGDPGMGKTSLVVALFGAWLHAHGDASARFVEAFTLAQARARHPLGEGEAPAVERAIEAGLLVLDDLGSEEAMRSAVLSDVLQARHNAERSTWVTSWLTGEDMAKRYGAGVCRRVFEGAKSVVLG